jgi:hypothetical protein
LAVSRGEITISHDISGNINQVHFIIEQKDADPINRSGTQLEGLRRVDPGLLEKIYTESGGKSIQWIETSR